MLSRTFSRLSKAPSFLSRVASAPFLRSDKERAQIIKWHFEELEKEGGMELRRVEEENLRLQGELERLRAASLRLPPHPHDPLEALRRSVLSSSPSSSPPREEEEEVYVDDLTGQAIPHKMGEGEGEVEVKEEGREEVKEAGKREELELQRKLLRAAERTSLENPKEEVDMPVGEALARMENHLQEAASYVDANTGGAFSSLPELSPSPLGYSLSSVYLALLNPSVLPIYRNFCDMRGCAPLPPLKRVGQTKLSLYDYLRMKVDHSPSSVLPASSPLWSFFQQLPLPPLSEGKGRGRKGRKREKDARCSLTGIDFESKSPSSNL